AGGGERRERRGGKAVLNFFPPCTARIASWGNSPSKRGGGGAFYAVLAQVLDLLQHQRRVAYRALKVRFNLDDDYLEALKDELIYARRVAVDENARVLVWPGATASLSPPAVPVQVQDRAPLS